jgi:glucose/arabinose dehydrogenase
MAPSLTSLIASRGRRFFVPALLIGGLCSGLVACGRPSTAGDETGKRRPVAPSVSKAKPSAVATRTPLLTGTDALGDWTTDAPGVRRRITPADMPKPYATPSVDNGPHVVARTPDAWPKVLPGFKVEEFATDLDKPRAIITAPNGDLFVAESEPGRVKLLRDADGDGKAETTSVFASGLTLPFGLAFYPPGPNPQYLYVGNTDSVVRFPYRNGDTRARAPAETIVPDLPGYARLRGGGHWTRDVDFSRVQSHSASLDMVFYTGRQFPQEYHHDAFAAEHGCLEPRPAHGPGTR